MKVLRNFFTIVFGLAVGVIVNMALIYFGHAFVPLPEGADVSTADAIEASMRLFEPRHFVFPFLAHALGTLAGALVAFVTAASHKKLFAFAIGVMFLLGGVANAFMIPAPAWFDAADLLLAYIPMAWLGARAGAALTRNVPPKAL